MWTVLSADDTERLSRCVAIMQQMDSAYASLHVSHLAYRIQAEGAEVHFYSADDVEGVMVFVFHARQAHWRVWTTGFVGDLDRGEKSCRLGMARLGEFMEEHGLDEIVAIRRLRIEHPDLERSYSSVPQHPHFNVRVAHSMHDCVVWRISRADQVPVSSGI